MEVIRQSIDSSNSRDTEKASYTPHIDTDSMGKFKL